MSTIVETPKQVSFWKRHPLLLPGLVIFLLTFGFFLPAINDSFLSDDYDFLARMDAVHGWSEAWRQINPSGQGFWRPVLNASFLVNYWLAGEQLAWSYHLINNILHALSAVLLFLIVEELWKKRTLAMAAAVFFAIYPQHHESVTWIAGRTDVLAAFFFLAALYGWLLFLRLEKRPYFYGTLGLACVAALTKEMALTLPIIIILVDILKYGWRGFSYYRRRYWVLIIFYGWYFLGRWLSIHKIVGGYSAFGSTVHWRLSFFHILLSPLYFFTKAINYDFLLAFMPRVGFLFTYRVVFLIVVLLGLGWLGWAQRESKSIRALLMLYILAVISAAPAWAMLPGIQHNGMDSRFLYFPTIFVAIALAYVACPAAESRRWVKVGAWCSVGMIGLWSVSGFIINYLPWQRASVFNERVLAAVAAMARRQGPQPLVYAANLPDNYYGAYLYRNGFEEAAENAIGDELYFVNPDIKKIWLLRSRDTQNHMCDKSFLNPTDVWVWNDKTERLESKKELWYTKDSRAAPEGARVEQRNGYQLLVWPNRLWLGEPFFSISYPKKVDYNTFVSICPLWVLADRK